MNADIKSQIDRAKELLSDLQESANNDLNKKEVSDKTTNLTQEILVKMRSVFDQSMYYFFEQEIKKNLSSNQQKKARIYFPIIAKQEDLKSILGRAMIKNLESTHPKIFALIDSIQPYNKNYEWMQSFSDFANEKHIRLTPQKRNETKSLFIGKNGTGIRLTGNASIKMGRNTSMRIGGAEIPGGQEISPNSDFIKSDPELGIKKEIWVSFTLGDSNVDAIKLCKQVINKGELILDDFFKILEN